MAAASCVVMPAVCRQMRAAAQPPAAARPCLPPRRLAAAPARRRPEVAARALDAVREGLDMQAFNELLSQHEFTLVDFYTTWCGPCKVLAVALKALEGEYQQRGVAFEKIDAQTNYAVAQEFKVSKLPTLILFNAQGEAVDRYEGVLSAQDLDMRLRTLIAAKQPVG